MLEPREGSTEKDKEKANKVAQQVRRAAALTAEFAALSEKKTAVVCDQPPELDELAGYIEAPNMVAHTPGQNDARSMGHIQTSMPKTTPLCWKKL